MTLTTSFTGTRNATKIKEFLLHDGSVDLQNARTSDAQLLAELEQKNRLGSRKYSEPTGIWFPNPELAVLAKNDYSEKELSRLEALLLAEGTLSVPTISGLSVDIDGETKPVTIVAATEINTDTPNHGDMASMLYLRDHIQAASALMSLYLQNPEHYQKEGGEARTLLFSALHLISTPAQLARFEAVIDQGNAVGQKDWPHISLHFEDMNGKGPNGWRNKQDSFQMLGYLALDALEKKFIPAGSLSESHKKFLASIVPFLDSVGFPHYESSGSWEENEATRTSVMAVETALLYKIKTMSAAEELAFLGSKSDSFTETTHRLYMDGLREIGKRLPYESPEYATGTVKHRQADAALVYVLMYDLPKLLAEEQIPIGKEGAILTRRQIEDLILEQLSRLDDSATNGMYRYENDSYQRVNFHTNEVQLVIRGIKRHVKAEANTRDGEIDLDMKQSLRDELTPRGKPATWTHPLGQLSAWAAGRSIESQSEDNLSDAKEYRELSVAYLNRVLSLVTGPDQYHAVLDADGRYEIRRVPPYRLPECYVAYELPTGEIIDVPSPHTPLNWSSAMARQSIGLLKNAVAAS
jgi:hypothetical protein